MEEQIKIVKQIEENNKKTDTLFDSITDIEIENKNLFP